MANWSLNSGGRRTHGRTVEALITNQAPALHAVPRPRRAAKNWSIPFSVMIGCTVRRRWLTGHRSANNDDVYFEEVGWFADHHPAKHHPDLSNLPLKRCRRRENADRQSSKRRRCVYQSDDDASGADLGIAATGYQSCGSVKKTRQDFA